MALYDLVAVSTTTTGTGTLTLGPAVAGYRSFSGASIPNGTVVSYAIESGTNRETGTGTVGASGTTLTRTLKASTTGSLLNLSGTSTVFITALASDFPAFATVAEIWAAATGGKTVTAENLTEAMAPVALTVSGGNLAINGNNGINFSATFTANTTIPNPTNKKPGRTSVVSISLTGGPWTTSLGSEFKKYAASPAIPTASGSKFDLILTFTATDVFYSVLVKP